MTEKLKPCPFCGSEAEVYPAFGAKIYYYALCKKCGAASKRYRSTEDTINAWNTRADNQEA